MCSTGSDHESQYKTRDHKELPMEQEQVNKLARQFKQTFSEQEINTLGKSVGFCKREREITPFRLCMGLIDVFANTVVETIADIQRAFNALCETNIQYKPFHNQLAKKQFPEFMRMVLVRLLEQLAGDSLRFNEDSPFSQFAGIILHDGTSFAVKSTLKDIFPGRFTKTSPAAVELHVALDLLNEQVSRVILTPDTDSEPQHLPAAEELEGYLLLGDRGYFKKEYISELNKYKGCFIIRGKSNMNPRIVFAISEDGKERTSWHNKSLHDIRRKLLKKQRMDLDIEWSTNGHMTPCRLIISWDKKRKSYQYLLTNLSRTEFQISHVEDAYHLRWQIELLFKEWKSYANLHAFDTSNPNIAEGLIWASLCAATLKRYYACMTQKLAGEPISTRKVAMCVNNVLRDVFHALIHCHRRLNSTIKRALEYLSKNARRAHPQRDIISGRSMLGLMPVYI